MLFRAPLVVDGAIVELHEPNRNGPVLDTSRLQFFNG